MEPDYQSDILKRLRELNALISCHIAKTKNDVKQLEILALKTKTSDAAEVRADLTGLRELAMQWKEQCN